MEINKSVDQNKLRLVGELLAARPAAFSQQGCVVASWRLVADRRLGPYFSLRYRHERRQRSVYLGASAALASAVRQLLGERRRVRRQRLALTRLRATIKASLRRHLPTWRRQLQAVGLKLKGFEVRNWKSLRVPAALSRTLAPPRRR
jgi:hypothetical protein